MGRFQQEIITRLKYRDLFKQAYAASIQELDSSDIKIFKKLEDGGKRREKEQELEDVFHIPKGHIILDVPRPELLRAEPRINQTDICVMDRGILKNLDDFTPVAKAIRSRVSPDWAVMIITDEKYRARVGKNAARVLFS
jgi:HD superfamily phosphohydrolase